MAVPRVLLTACLAFAGVTSAARIPRQAAVSEPADAQPAQVTGSVVNPATQGAVQNTDPECKANPPNPQFCDGPNDPKDPEDLSYIKTWAAIGDSYSAGIGAGNELDYKCRRYDGAYPALMNEDVRLGDPTGRQFTFVACSGAETPGIIEQANGLAPGQQVITISAGGNDALLVNVLNDCVYNWYGGFSDNCEKSLQASSTIIESPEFSTALGNTIKAAQAKLAPGGQIFYTGYAKFFDDTTNECDTVSWHYWLNLWTKQYLTQARRTAMNTMVDSVNQKIAAAVQTAGAGVTFINYDDYFGQLQGRYCQPGVDETKKKGAENRVQLLFYETHTTVDTPWAAVAPNDNLNGKRNLLDFTEGMEEHNLTKRYYWIAPRQDISANDPRDLPTEINDDISRAFLENPNAQLDPDVVPDDIIPWLKAEGIKVPDTPGKRDLANKIPVSWARVFHPQQGGHLVIANQVLNSLAAAGYTRLGLPVPAEDFKSPGTCPR